MSHINFGTDGWRAVMADQFTFDNVRLVARAIALHLLEKGGAGQAVVVGYDRRFLSEHFARAVTEVLVEYGLHVLLTGAATPTPVTAFAVRHRAAAGAVMLTASHNPPEYNGIKFIPDYAGPALPDVTDSIERHLRELEGGAPAPPSGPPGSVEVIFPKASYLAHLHRVVDLGAAAGLAVIVDPMYGAGAGYLEELLSSTGATVQAVREERDPLFGGDLPEPSAARLEGLGRRVRESGAVLGLALDGDADRFGLLDGDGSYITPNQFLAVCLHHLIQSRGWRDGSVARTVATTHLLDRIADYFGLAVHETPVGFKYIGQALREKEAVLGGEESGGMSIRGHLPEKDGILAAALAVEIVSRTGRRLAGLLEEVQHQYGPLYSERLDVTVPEKRKEELLRRVRGYSPAKLGGRPVVQRLTVDGTKLVLSDGSWVLIRPSGTEPLFRIYGEAGDGRRLAMLQEELRNELDI